ncbi:MAG: glycosyltransferase [Acidobacteriota bacterium]
MFDLEFTGERMVPGKVEPELQLEHVSRYHFAAQVARGRRLLDFGCGAGYGAAILQKAGARSTIGCDLAADAIAFARSRYRLPGLHFFVTDCEQAALPDGAFDLIVAFEIIEHLRSYRSFLGEVRRLLAPQGLFILSTPNKETYRSEPGTAPNPFHLHEFELGELLDELEPLFSTVQVVGQSQTEGVFFSPASHRGTPEARLQRPRRQRHEPQADYLIAVCSDAELAPAASYFHVAESNALRNRTERVLQLQGELEERTRWAKGLEDESARRGQRILELQDELEERTRWAKGLQQESEGRARRILELQTELEERMRWATQIEKEHEESGRRVLELQRELEIVGESVQRLDGLEDKVADRLQAIEASVSDRLAPFEGTEERLIQRLASLEARFEHGENELEQSLRWHHESLLRQRQELESQRDELSRGTRQARDATRRVARHEIELQTLTRRAREVETAAKTAQQLIDVLWGSRSWKVFAALRRSLSLGGRRKPPAGAPSRLPEAPRALQEPPPASALAGLPEVTQAPDATLEVVVYVPESSPLACLPAVAEASRQHPVRAHVAGPGADVVAALGNLSPIAAEEPIAALLAAARSASAPFVVLFSGDVALETDAFDRLLETFEAEPQAGLLVGKILDPQGKVAEAGSVLWRDGSSTPYGAGLESDAAEISFPRWVDFGRSQFLALRTAEAAELEVSSRDEEAAIELALELRRRALGCLYQPAITVRSARALATSPAVPRRELRQRWSESLSHQGAVSEDLDRHREPGRRRRALIIDHRVPTPDQDAGSVRMTALVDAFRESHFQVTFLPENLYEMAPYGQALRQQKAELIVTPQYTSLEAYLERHGEAFDLVLVSRFHIASGCLDLVRRLCPDARLVFDTVDLQFLRLERRAALEQDVELEEEAHRLRESELQLARKADATLVVSRSEAEILGREAPDLDVRLLSLIHSTAAPSQGFEERRDFYFVGGYEHPPNIDAARWFVSEILPRVRQELPTVRFLLIGSKAPAELRVIADEHTEIVGFVEDMDPYLDGCRLSVAPLRYGAGIKGKVTQSLSHGLPCVMTSVAAEGIGLSHGEDAMIADDADSFAQAIIAVYRDAALWQRLSQAGLERIKEDFSPRAARRAIESLCHDFGLTAGAPRDER